MPGRRRSSRCPKCGYSLKGLTNDVCPECGLSLDPATLRALLDRPPALTAYVAVMRLLTVVALIGVAGAVGDLLPLFGPRPRTPATTATGVGLCLFSVFLAHYWSSHEQDTVSSRPAMVWTHGVLAMLLGAACISLGWWVVH